jgi:cytochrome c5
MKKIILLSLVCSAIAMACHKKTVPEMTSRTDFPEPPKSAKSPVVENSLEAIAAGKILFETKCNRCHDLKDTKVYTADRWATILRTMIPRARLNDEQAKQVTSYVMVNARK